MSTTFANHGAPPCIVNTDGYGEAGMKQWWGDNRLGESRQGLSKKTRVQATQSIDGLENHHCKLL